MSSQNVNLYLTSEHPCGYLPDRMATNLVPDPNMPMTMALYSQLVQLGYRRSGSHTYRPHCKDCNECIPCRINVRQFKPNRSQRRCLQANSACTTRMVKAGFQQTHFDLYERYINSRHADGSMANPTPDEYSSFLYSDWSDTLFLEIHDGDKLIAVAVCDHVDNGLSAVYSYFEPEMQSRSLGTLCILKTLEHARQMQFDYVYLGYLIHDNQKMRYKKMFQPLEIFQHNRWIDYKQSIYDAAS
jgi:arginine-tRNA-protein transferase